MASEKTAAAPAAAEAPARIDETIPGGKFIVKGVVVDANGKPLEDQSEAPARPAAPAQAPAAKPLAPPAPPAK